MSEIANVQAAKTHFSRLLERAEAGEEIVIARAGKPVARLVPFKREASASRRLARRDLEPPKRVFGRLKGQIRIMPGFHDLDSEVERDFEESIAKPLEP